MAKSMEGLSQRNMGILKDSPKDVADRVKWCALKGKQYPLLACLKCKRFPCGELKSKDLLDLENSSRVVRVFEAFTARRVAMHVFKLRDGKLMAAPASFNPQDPDPESLRNVEEIYAVSKILEPKFKLVVKGKERGVEENPSAGKKRR